MQETDVALAIIFPTREAGAAFCLRFADRYADRYSDTLVGAGVSTKIPPAVKQ